MESIKISLGYNRYIIKRLHKEKGGVGLETWLLVITYVVTRVIYGCQRRPVHGAIYDANFGLSFCQLIITTINAPLQYSSATFAGFFLASRDFCGVSCSAIICTRVNRCCILHEQTRYLPFFLFLFFFLFFRFFCCFDRFMFILFLLNEWDFSKKWN